jgi:hypothetical protein
VPTSTKLLKIYLADSRALLVANMHVAARCLARNRRGRLGELLDELKLALEDDMAVLDEVISSLNGRRNRFKDALAWSATVVGRLKLNGAVISYSDLSRVYELEGLCWLTDHRTWLWRALGTRLERSDLQRLIERSERQRAELDRFRAEAAATALST